MIIAASAQLSSMTSAHTRRSSRTSRCSVRLSSLVSIAPLSTLPRLFEVHSPTAHQPSILRVGDQGRPDRKLVADQGFTLPFVHLPLFTNVSTASSPYCLKKANCYGHVLMGQWPPILEVLEQRLARPHLRPGQTERLRRRQTAQDQLIIRILDLKRKPVHWTAFRAELRIVRARPTFFGTSKSKFRTPAHRACGSQ